MKIEGILTDDDGKEWHIGTDMGISPSETDVMTEFDRMRDAAIEHMRERRAAEGQA